MNTNNRKNMIYGEGAIAIANAVAVCQPGVVAAYPITPQTHIVEELARLKANGANYQFVQAESEAAAASIVLGAAATGQSAYTATSSQGLLHMLEVLYNAAGLNLPMVITVANRSLSAPLNILNDHSDAMAMRDAGFIMLFAENIQEAVDMHIIAFRLAVLAQRPVAVNVDGFLLTHASEGYRPIKGSQLKNFILPIKQILNPNKPVTLGHMMSAEFFQLERQRAQVAMVNNLKIINNVFHDFYKRFSGDDNGLCEYYGPTKAEIIIIAMGSVCGTIKDELDHLNATKNNYALLRLKTYRPLPILELKKYLKNKKKIIVLDRALSLGSTPPLSADIASICHQTIISCVSGLGGKPITAQMIKSMLNLSDKKSAQINFI